MHGIVQSAAPLKALSTFPLPVSVVPPDSEERVAALLSFRPVEVTFEEIPKASATVPATRKPAAPAKKSKAAAAGAKPAKAGAKGKAPKDKGTANKGSRGNKGKGKKSDKVTTVRKVFKIQPRAAQPPQAKEGGGGGGGGSGSGHIVPTITAASSTSAVI